MSGSQYDRARAQRSRGRPGGRPGARRRQGGDADAITVALVTQILLCVLVLLVANIYRRVDIQGYESAHREYTALVGEEANDLLGVYLEELGGFGQGFFASVENLLQRAFGGPTPNAGADAGAVEPDTAGEGAEDGTGTAGLDLGYSYLPDSDDPDNNELGRGGYNPVGTLADAEQYLPAPAGSSLAPVVLSADVKPPITGLVTSLFAYRIHPITGQSDFHTGMDIAAVEGRGILAALSGEVVEVGWSDIYGNYIILQHATNLQTFYAHCSEIIAAEGMAVRQGQRIAKVGQTGMTTGPHLHFSVIVDGLFVDPRHILSDYLVPVED